MSSPYPAVSENGGHDGVEMAKQEGRRSAENIDPPVTGNWRRVSRCCSCPATSENGRHDGDMMANQEGEGHRNAKNIDPPATGSRRGGGAGMFGLNRDDNGALVVVATLITTLSYEVGSNVPGGYWQDDAPGHHRAGELIMRTQRLWLYHVFIWSSWIGFAASMGLTLALLTSVPPRARFVRGLFVPTPPSSSASLPSRPFPSSGST
ncbi:hypothetical protein BAE44_0011946 [Dichanthelium oligosanthes]|uniref:PGG domain-containing protein n=1 Tax=Dichanthelium oligosanthes TaxID=888268 RepID=A0A1E5VPP6_9POAL|nr:hypothetical protein BAE44_0011946 [Dichanthelium oligosanthes]